MTASMSQDRRLHFYLQEGIGVPIGGAAGFPFTSAIWARLRIQRCASGAVAAGPISKASLTSPIWACGESRLGNLLKRPIWFHRLAAGYLASVSYGHTKFRMIEISTLIARMAFPALVGIALGAVAATTVPISRQDAH